MTSASAGVSFTVLSGYWESLIAGAEPKDKRGPHLNSRPPDKMPPAEGGRPHHRCSRRRHKWRAFKTVEPENQEAVEPAPEGLKPRRKGIYLLPNLMTTGCLFSGFYGIVAAIDKNFEAAGKAVFIAMI